MNAPHAMLAGPYARDPWLEYSRGKVPGFSHVNKFGFNSDIDNAAGFKDIWDGGSTLWVPPTTARLHNIASTSALDDLGNTGAEIVEVQGLNENFARVVENVTLNGQSNVPTVKTYVMIHRMRVMQSNNGANDTENAGNITATAATDGTVTAQISIGFNQTLMAIYMIPANEAAYMVALREAVGKRQTSSHQTQLWARADGGPWQIKDIGALITAGTSRSGNDYKLFPKFDAKTIIKIKADSDTNDAGISAGFDLLCVAGD